MPLPASALVPRSYCWNTRSWSPGAMPGPVSWTATEHAVAVPRHDDAHLPAARRELHRVPDEVPARPVGCGARPRPRAPARPGRETVSSTPAWRAASLTMRWASATALPTSVAAQVEVERARLDLRLVEELVDEAQEVAARAGDVLDVGVLVLVHRARPDRPGARPRTRRSRSAACAARGTCGRGTGSWPRSAARARRSPPRRPSAPPAPRWPGPSPAPPASGRRDPEIRTAAITANQRVTGAHWSGPSQRTTA